MVGLDFLLNVELMRFNNLLEVSLLEDITEEHGGVELLDLVVSPEHVELGLLQELVVHLPLVLSLLLLDPTPLELLPLELLEAVGLLLVAQSLNSVGPVLDTVVAHLLQLGPILLPPESACLVGEVHLHAVEVREVDHSGVLGVESPALQE